MNRGFPGNSRPGGLNGAFGPLASILSAGLTILLAPQAWPWIERPVIDAIFDLYDRDVAGLLYWTAQIGFWPLVFFSLRVGIMGAFLWLSLNAARRLM